VTLQVLFYVKRNQVMDAVTVWIFSVQQNVLRCARTITYDEENE